MADWGTVDDKDSLSSLHHAAHAGINLIDNADFNGDGLKERDSAGFLKERAGERMYVATKMGRRVEQRPENYTPEAFVAWTQRSRDNLDTEMLDLVQLHCPPFDVYYTPELFAAMDEMVQEGVMRHYGVSVEKIEQAQKALEYPGTASVQIIFNMVRQRPADRFLAEALASDVGVLARVPLASGLLTGKYDAASTFAEDDHRHYNRHGEAFDVGETFAGLDYSAGLAFVAAVQELVPEGASTAQLALRWILMHEGVTAAIPGAKNPAQAQANAAAADLPPLSHETMLGIRELYEELAMPLVHQRW